MSPHLKFMITSAIIMVFLQFTCGRVHAQNVGESDEITPGKIFADVSIGTNAVEWGLTQTDSSPSMLAQLGYKWTQFKMGLLAANVKFGNSPETMNLRLFLAYKFIFTRNAHLTARYDLNRYFNSSTRDGAITNLNLNTYDYHVTYDRAENWDGRQAANVRWGFYKSFELSNYAAWSLGTGYNLVEIEGLSNYFDVMSSISYTVSELKYELVGSYNSQSAQFDGRGGAFGFLRFSASF